MTTSPTFRKSTRPITSDDDEPRKPRDIPTSSRVEVPSERPGPVAKWAAARYREFGNLISNFDNVCGPTVTMSADTCGMAWQRAYKTSPFFKNLIDKLMASSVAADLFFGHLPIMMAVLAHHNPKFREKMEHTVLSHFIPTEPDDAVPQP